MILSSLIENLSDIVRCSADAHGDRTALKHKNHSLSYAELAVAMDEFAAALLELELPRFGRIALFTGKQPETVIAAFAASRIGGVFVPINPIFKPAQVAYLLQDCAVQILVTTKARLDAIQSILPDCGKLRHVIVIDDPAPESSGKGLQILAWQSLLGKNSAVSFPRPIGSDMAAIMYTSGSTGKPKGVVLSQANMTIGAASVAQYLENSAEDRILSVLPLSFDAGLSQLTTGFHAGACVVLHDYFLASDIVRMIERERITGITGVPPLWMQLTEQKWPDGSTDEVRYFANTGGKMPRKTLGQLRKIFPHAKPYLMYGLTESFRSTYLPPSEVDLRPDSMGKAIPNVEVMVVADDGSLCGAGEVGELVHRGPLVSLGYWNDPERTAARFRPAPGQPAELPNPELAVWSGDSVKMDDAGFLYFVGRKDDMIKTSGYRVSPAEIEEVVYDSGLVAEVAALGVANERLGQSIVLLAKPKNAGDQPTEALLEHMRVQVPNYMVPHAVHWRDSLPRNANGKLDRRAMSADLVSAAEEDET